MTWLRSYARRLLALFRKDRLEDDLADELQFHLDMEIEENRRAGMGAIEARRAAHAKLGGLERTKVLYREQRGLPSIEGLVQDLRHAGRTLRRSPGFTLAAVLSLALGIGANTAIFSLINALILRPMPFPEPERLVNVWETHTWQGRPSWGSVAWGNIRDLRDQNTVFGAVAVYQTGGENLAADDETVRVRSAVVEGELFDVLGVPPLLGRVFEPEEARRNPPEVVVLGYGLWQSRFAADPDVVGRSVMLGGAPHVVVGVMPATFDFPPRSGVQIWTPLTLDPTQSWREGRGSHWLSAVARLRPGVSLSAAGEQARAIAARLERDYPDANTTRSFTLHPFHTDTVAGVAAPLVVLAGAVGLVLLLACANVAHMTLARAVTRRRELAVRLALGASRLRLVRLLLVENAALAVAGGLAGLLAADVSLDALLALPMNPLPPDVPIPIDGVVLAYCALASLAAALMAGLVPTLRVRQINLQTGLKEGDAVFGARVAKSRSLLMTAEVALALVLAIGAVLLLTSLRRLTTIDLGFRTDRVLAMTVALPERGYQGAGPIAGAWDDVLGQVAAIPGVESAGVTSMLPLWRGTISMSFTIPGRPPDRPGFEPSGENRVVSADYFQTMGIPLVAGRTLTDEDGRDGRKVVLVNQRCAERFWPGEDPIGRRIGFGTKPEPDGWATVIGVVGNVRNGGVNSPLRNVVYEPHTQVGFGWKSMSLVVRTLGEPTSAVGAIRAAVGAVDRDATVFQIRTLDEIVNDSVAPTRFLSWLLSVFGGLALVLAIVGVYGVMAHLVARRTHEIGVRMALGAERRTILGMVLGQGLAQTAVGLAAGLGLAMAFSGLMRRFVIGIGAIDIGIYAAAAGAVLAAAAAASYVPARRAAKLDPMIALRDE